MALRSIIYVSSATELFTSETLRDLLAVSRRNNAARGISGILLYWDGNFLQYLEGPREQLDLLMTKVGRIHAIAGLSSWRATISKLAPFLIGPWPSSG